MTKTFIKLAELVPGLYAFAQGLMPAKLLPEALTLRRGLQDWGRYVAMVATVVCIVAGAVLAKRVGPKMSLGLGLATLIAWFGSIFGFYEYSLNGGKAATPPANAGMVALWSAMFFLLAFALTLLLTQFEDKPAES